MNYTELTSELSNNFIEYAAAVNEDRSIPDARSGLKPVARRILWGSYNKGFTSDHTYVKCAKIVGEVLAVLHPHGSDSVYDALVRLSKDWIMRYPLIDFHGNGGNIAGDGPASYRYTNARLAKIAEEGMLCNIKKRNVDFVPNYDEDDEEPSTLPSIFPNLLCNPNEGLGVGLASNWGCSNLGEVAQAIYNYMDGKEFSLSPDFPTGGIVINKNIIKTINETGKGSLKIRGKYHVENNQIIFTEIPYKVTIEAILESVANACDKGEIQGVEDIQDYSDRNGINIVITCEKNANINQIMKKLFAKTLLQTSFAYNQIALVNKTPTLLNLRQCIEVYLSHNKECLIKEFNFDLKRIKERLHIIDGLLIALEDIDNIIELIRKSENGKDAKEKLIQKYNLSEEQSKSILAMRLSSLAKLEKLSLQQEKEQLEKEKFYKEDALTNENIQNSIIRERLQKIVDKYGDERRTTLLQLNEIKEEELPTVAEEVVVTATSDGLVKRTFKKNYKPQRRYSVGVKNNKKQVIFAQLTNTNQNLLVFSSDGKMHKILVNDITEGKETNIRALINMESAPMAYCVKENRTYVLFSTKNGILKKTALSEYENISKRKQGVVALKLKENDSLISVSFVNEEDEILLVTKKGLIIRINSKEVPATGRATMGVKGIKLGIDDEVIYCAPVSEEYLCVVNISGEGKLVKMNEFVTQTRGGKGIVLSKIDVASICQCGKNDNLLIIGASHSLSTSVSELPISSRTASGNLLMKNNEQIYSITKI